MRTKRILGAMLALSLAIACAPAAWAQGVQPQGPSPWSYPPDLQAPTDAEYQGVRERFEEGMRQRAAHNWSAAAPLFRENLAVYWRTYGPEHPVTGMAMFVLGGTLDAQEQYPEAETLMADSIRIAQTWLPEGNAWYGIAYGILGRCQGANGKRALAEVSFRRAIEISHAAGDASSERTARLGLEEMTRFYQQSGQ
ncbi:MAG: tetratricopeptide repeat protein [Hyphomonadaceae bacterium]|nr:tetratricopeptide repeat protein [Hyphomonadaceae bacterium]